MFDFYPGLPHVYEHRYVRKMPEPQIWASPYAISIPTKIYHEYALMGSPKILPTVLGDSAC